MHWPKVHRIKADEKLWPRQGLFIYDCEYYTEYHFVINVYVCWARVTYVKRKTGFWGKIDAVCDFTAGLGSGK
jgi:hypothetical protein